MDQIKKLSDTEIEEIIRKMDRMFSEEGYYNIFRPEYVLEHVYDESDRDLRAEFYAYAMTNEHVVYSSMVVKCSGTIVNNYQIVALDGGRYTTPTPEWGFLGKRLTENDPEFSYKYFLKDSFDIVFIVLCITKKMEKKDMRMMI